MATFTSNLGIPLIEPTDLWGKEATNRALDKIDQVVAPKTHINSKAHFDMWEASKNYSLNDVVRVETIPSWGYLKCTQAGVSGLVEPLINPVVLAYTDNTVKWELKAFSDGGSGGSGGGDIAGGFVSWEADKLYKIGATVKYQNTYQRCITEHTSTSTFEQINWELLGIDVINDWVTNKIYSQKMVVVYNNKVYRCSTEHTSTAFLDDISNWELLAGDTHTHANKAVLDELGDTGGKLTYLGQDVGGVDAVMVLDTDTYTPYTAVGTVTNFTIPDTKDKILTLVKENLLMIRGVDYSIDYLTGVVTLTEPLADGEKIYYKLNDIVPKTEVMVIDTDEYTVYTAVADDTYTFNIGDLTNKVATLLKKNLVMVKSIDYMLTATGDVTLTYPLKTGDKIYYKLNDIVPKTEVVVLNSDTWTKYTSVGVTTTITLTDTKDTALTILKENLTLIKDVDYTINYDTGLLTLTEPLQDAEVIYYKLDRVANSQPSEFHTHTNKTVLDALGDNAGKLTFNGADVVPTSYRTLTFSLVDIEDNEQSAIAIIPQDLKLTKINVISNDHLGAAVVPSAGVALDLYNSTVIDTVTLTTATVEKADLNIDLVKGSLIYYKVNGAINGLVNLSIILSFTEV